MTPTVFRYGKYQFYFFSLEENRMHIHVHSPDGEAKFWIEPIISLDCYYGLSKKQLNELQQVVEENQNEIKKQWKKHFKKS